MFYLPHSAPTNTGSDDNSVLTIFRLDGWFESLHPSQYTEEPKGHVWTEASYKGETLLCQTAWFTMDERCTCEYGYSDTLQPQIKSLKMSKVLHDITQSVCKVVGADENDLNSANLNYYPQGGGVGFHADDEFLFDGLNRETCIISLSLSSPIRLGPDAVTDKSHDGERKFEVKRKGKQYADEITEIILRHGDIITMEGYFQKYHLHSVWPGDSKSHDHLLCQGERINLTWRKIVKHLDGSDECRGLLCPLHSS